MRHLPTIPIPQELPNSLVPGLGSWFYHVNEPIWQVNTLAFAHPKPSSISLSTLPDGQRIDFGSLQIAYPLEWTQYVWVDRRLSGEVIQKVQKGMPIPVNTPQGLKGTQFQFLVCLDGYVRPQLAMAFRIANAFRDLHKKHHPQSVQRGAPAIAVEIEVLPNAAGSGMGLYAQLSGPAVRIRKNWRVVTIDVAGALTGQQEYVDRKLIQQQKELGDQLTFPLRLRPRGEDDLKDNALKRALCIYELHRHGADSQGTQRPLSHMRISHAIYCEDMPEYYDVRGIPIPPSVANARASTPSADFLDRAREGLELGSNLIQGWYEFVTSRQFKS
ncbi:hypothetical protein os1_02740 [Comamonadaceae bacterium OS-1]|nr:hypothetical protein os1_02740 [Comamonadaceae bacterium OS-1]